MASYLFCADMVSHQESARVYRRCNYVLSFVKNLPNLEEIIVGTIFDKSLDIGRLHIASDSLRIVEVSGNNDPGVWISCRCPLLKDFICWHNGTRPDCSLDELQRLTFIKGENGWSIGADKVPMVGLEVPPTCHVTFKYNYHSDHERLLESAKNAPYYEEMDEEDLGDA